MGKIKVGIIGATGYTGSELVRILLGHPEVKINAITSESHKGKQFSDIHSSFRSICDTRLISANELNFDDIDIAFLALPHGVSMDFVKTHSGKAIKIVDLSGDFRLGNKESYLEWYGQEHIYEKGLQEAVFGVPELFADRIKNASLIANPGCYPTSAILGMAPLVNGQLVESRIIIDSKSGVTGAGVKPKTGTHYPNVNEDFKAYGVKTHRHTVEIEEQLSFIGNKKLKVQFTPHLLPVDRGIVSTMYAVPTKKIDEAELAMLYKTFYKDKPFIRLLGSPPSIKDVRGTNYCDIFVTYDNRTENIIVISAIDNLVRGAAGQAVQNMNLLYGLDETAGLRLVPLNP